MNKHPPDIQPTVEALTPEQVAKAAGVSIAESILERVDELPEREGMLELMMEAGLESIPSQIVYDGLEGEAAPVFVVYKLLHEAFSNSPQFFRRFITSVMEAQPHRFSCMFSRETLWSLVARQPGHDPKQDWASFLSIRDRLQALNKKGIWRRSEQELDREASYLADTLSESSDPDKTFRTGVETLRRLQTERSTGFTNGNLLLFVPAKLNQYVSEVAELGMHGHLPSLTEISQKLHEIVRDQIGEGRHQSIPIDILFTDFSGDSMECFILVREKESARDQLELRKRSLLVRYFLQYAFTAYKPDNLHVRFAFYLDPLLGFKPLPEPASLFHKEELIPFPQFWELISGDPNGRKLIYLTRDAASEKLRKSNFMGSIKTHFNRNSPPLQTTFFGR